MRMTLEGSNSAETFSPWSGGAGSHRLLVWDGFAGLVINFCHSFLSFFLYIFLILFPYSIWMEFYDRYLGARSRNNSMIEFLLRGSNHDRLKSITVGGQSLQRSITVPRSSPE
ncbi:hypothetical protein L228DRAFT_44040 [Xylona heveae TC161]|uniref:Uncharacterized protein n=1 Tax=Xylona heveae (strain CBS 132557 / TC161) TaxID=1328760 RepID=A0A164ZT50_XYLHT|nr:hypothetical protein L228DRAFT_44040 [Xylona heveae TC161]KZF19478.1 hypothetical protein L228DRAFT_44040 [Xylona heveae TC161]